MLEKAQLPPLILHPFNGAEGADGNSALVEGSRASLALQGLIPSEEDEPTLNARMLAGRYQEVRMLLFLGKDLFRWLQQCVEFLSSGDSNEKRIAEQSFAAMVVEEPPECVNQKLQNWGVTDRRSIFSRAIGIHSLFQNPPELEDLSPIFLGNYHRFADHAYICYQHLQPFLPIDASRFHFEIYASEEYSRMLSDEWQRAEL